MIFVLAAVILQSPLRLYLLAAGLFLFTPAILWAAWPAYKRTIIIAAVLFGLSVLVFGGGMLVALYLLAVVLFLFVPAFIWSAFTNRQKARMRLHRIGLYLFTFLALCVQEFLQEDIAQRHAVEIGNACLAYRSKYHHYPQNLDELVPEFLSSVPNAKLGIFNQFFYAPPLTKDGEPTLWYVQIPPFGRACYHVKDGSWGHLD